MKCIKNTIFKWDGWMVWTTGWGEVQKHLTKTKTFREQLQRAILETYYLWDILAMIDLGLDVIVGTVFYPLISGHKLKTRSD